MGSIGMAAVDAGVRDFLDPAEYRAVLNAAPDAVFIVDADGKIQFASERVQAVFGYSAGELLDSSIDRLVPAGYRATHASRRAAFARSPSARPRHCDEAGG